MRTVISNHELLPRGLKLEALSIEAAKIVTLFASSYESRAHCPLCGSGSSRVHSRYLRTVSDLPWHGVSVKLDVRVRRFFCDETSCQRRIFCERLPEVAARARKTDRLEEALLAIVLGLGGRAGARLAAELGLVVGRDVLLRMAKSAPLPGTGETKVLGVDDFAFRRGHAYGTILVDLEQRRVVDLLPERSQESLLAWLRRHPEIEFAARDRSHIYREALAPPAQPRARARELPAPEATRPPQGGHAGDRARRQERRSLRLRTRHAEPTEDPRPEDRGGREEAPRAPGPAMEGHSPPLPRRGGSQAHL